ncbi:MAG: sigma-54 dependent transcriptional regulator [Pirellulaceae bacterium]
MRQKLLIVDDEPNVLATFKKRLESESLEVMTAQTGREGIELAESHRPSAMLLDMRLPDMTGLETFAEIRRRSPRLPVVMITAYSTTEMAIDAMKHGAFEYLLKPVDINQLREIVDRALELSHLRQAPILVDQADGGEDGSDRIMGHSAVMQEVYKSIGRIASEEVNVLILGDSGTGKELVARAIYNHSARHDQTFLAINCAALPENLLESELFGHERGAFTGADHRRIGKFEQANGGTIFLDELGDMSLSTQAKMLRLLQDGRFERVGGNETIQTDVRVIAATNQDLAKNIVEGKFRQDLYFRLNGFTIPLPPLRKRREDIRELIEHFLNLPNGSKGQRTVRMTSETLRLLENYDWPGNVRELQSVVKYARVHAVGEVITPDCLPEVIRGTLGEEERPEFFPAETRESIAQVVRQMLREQCGDIHRRVQEEVDRIAIQEALQHVGGNQVQASERLGISRTTLRAKLSHWEPTGTGEVEPS